MVMTDIAAGYDAARKGRAARSAAWPAEPQRRDSSTLICQSRSEVNRLLLPYLQSYLPISITTDLPTYTNLPYLKTNKPTYHLNIPPLSIYLNLPPLPTNKDQQLSRLNFLTPQASISPKPAVKTALTPLALGHVQTISQRDKSMR